MAFAEEAFRTPEGKVDFPTLLPKLYGPGADSAPLHTVLYEDGAPAGLYCLKIQDFNIAGTAPVSYTHLLPVREVAARLGYAGEIGIIRLFRKYEGTTPGDYRAQHK